MHYRLTHASHRTLLTLIILILVSGLSDSRADNIGNSSDTNASIGKSIYDGSHDIYREAERGAKRRIRDARDATLNLPAEQAACVACHRPSGLGSFEGGVAVPPIAGHLLFSEYDTATTKRYGFPNLLRVRPAYSEAQLRALLSTGRTPDGKQLSPLMPRYDMTAREVSALSAHLKSLSAERAPGVTDDTVTFATITSDDVPEADRQDLLSTLSAFFATKNAGTRGEFGRRAQAQRKEQVMYARHRNWVLRHWQLKGPPESWREQLDGYWSREPVFAVLSGMSGQSWQPVHEFCARTATPCILPMVELPPQSQDFYSIYFSRGLLGQLEAALAELNLVSKPGVQLVTPDDAAGRAQREALQDWLQQQGYALTQSAQQAQIVISTLPQGTISNGLNKDKLTPKTIILLGGAKYSIEKIKEKSDISAHVYEGAPLLMATDYVDEARARTATMRARAWMNSRGLKVANTMIGSNALFALTLAVESLMHVDEKFSREYCVEKLEHNLETLPAMTAYERLSIGPRQRFASKKALISNSAAISPDSGINSK